MDMTQQVTGDQMESGHGKLDYGTPTDDEEIIVWYDMYSRRIFVLKLILWFYWVD